MARTAKKGRPACFKTNKSFETQVNSYFDYCDNFESKVIRNGKRKKEHVHKPYTLTGLAIFLKVCPRTLYNYGRKEEFSDTYNIAKARVETNLLERCLKGDYNANIGKLILTASFDYKEGGDDLGELMAMLEKYKVDNIMGLVEILIQAKKKKSE